MDGPGLSPPETLAQLRARQGSHLDPEVVEALATVLGRRRGAGRADGASAPVPLPTEEASVVGGTGRTRGLPNHDLPAVSDAFAQWQPEASVRQP